jgi:hypothetical protein
MNIANLLLLFYTIFYYVCGLKNCKMFPVALGDFLVLCNCFVFALVFVVKFEFEVVFAVVIVVVFAVVFAVVFVVNLCTTLVELLLTGISPILAMIRNGFMPLWEPAPPISVLRFFEVSFEFGISLQISLKLRF